MNKRRIILDGTDNTRDLGGYPIGKNGMTQYGVFLRSAVPTGLSEEDCRLLRDMNITTVVDLRSDAEVDRTACYFDGREGFAYHHLEITGSGHMRGGQESIPEAYMSMLQCDAMPKIFRVFSAAPGGCLFHCSAGKDRTGITAAVLLMLAGVDDLDIIADYVLTYPYLVRLLEMISPDDPDFPAYIMRSDPEYIRGFLKLFHEKYGDAQTYLTDISLTEEEITRLKAKLTD